MAFPAIADVTESTNTGASDLTVNLPSTVNDDDLLILIGGSDALSGAGNLTVSGWTNVGQSGGGQNSSGIWWKAGVSGDSGGTATLDFQFSSSIAVSAAQVLRITGWDSGTNPEFSTFTSAVNSSPATGAVTASWGADDNLFITMVMTGDDDATVSSSSSGYSTLSNTSVGSSADDYFKVWHQYLESTAASDTPGTWTLSESETWRGVTAVVRGAAGGLSATVGQATEAQTSQTVGRAKARSVGQSVETNAAQGVTKATTTTLTITGITGGADLSGLQWLVLDAQDFSTASIALKGTGETTDSSGNLVIDLEGSGLTNGASVWYSVKDAAGNNAAQGPGTVVVA